MQSLRPTKNILAIVLGASALVASFALALAATLQTSVEVPASANLTEAQVLAGPGLHVSWDEAGNDQVTGLEFEWVELLPPLESDDHSRHMVFLRNDSDIELKIVGPCDDFFDENTGRHIGFVEMFRADGQDGGSCPWHTEWFISPGQVIRGEVEAETDEGGETEVGPGSYPFTVVFGAIGQDDDGSPPPGPDPASLVTYAQRNLAGRPGVSYLGGGGDATTAPGVAEFLFSFDNGDQMTPELIDTWSIDPLGETFTATLKDGIPWRSPIGFEYIDFGEATANDAVEWFNRKNPTTNGGSNDPDAGDLAAIFGQARGVDDLTFEVDLIFPVYYCLPISQFGCQGATPHFEKVTTVETEGEAWARDHRVGTGPFVQGHCQAWDECTLHAVNDHWRQTPEISGIRYLNVPDPGTRESMIRTGVVDMADMDFSKVPDLAVDGIPFLETMPGAFVGQSLIWSGNLWEETHARTAEPLNPWAAPAYAVDYPWIGNPWGHGGEACSLSVTCGDAPYTDTDNPDGMDDMEQARLVRLALGTVIDRVEINTAELNGQGVVLYSEYMGPEYPGWDPNRSSGVFDVFGNPVAPSGTAQSVPWQLADDDLISAGVFLDEAGYPLVEGVRSGFHPIVLQVYAAEAGEVNFPIAERIADSWRSLGVPVTVTAVNYGGVVSPRFRMREEFNPTLKNGDVHSNIFPLDSPLPAADTSITRPGWGVGFESPAGAQWYYEILGESDPVDRELKHLNWVDYSIFWQQYSGVYQVPKGLVVGPRINSWIGRQQHYTNVSSNPEFIELN